MLFLSTRNSSYKVKLHHQIDRKLELSRLNIKRFENDVNLNWETSVKKRKLFFLLLVIYIHINIEKTRYIIFFSDFILYI